MTKDEILVALIEDHYVLKAAYKKEQQQSIQYRKWWQEESEDKKKLSGIMTKEIKELQEVIDQAGAEKKEMNKFKKK